jgi:hypothetical protein
VGGQSGGNCWSDGGHYPLDSEPEPEFEQLDKLFETYLPNLSYVLYKRFCRECVTVSERTENEYYGNYSAYNEKEVSLYNLYKFLCENGAFSPK